MLLADKRELQNSLKVSLLQIEEKELNYCLQNCFVRLPGPNSAPHTQHTQHTHDMDMDMDMG
jgi:hypothetical protein